MLPLDHPHCPPIRFVQPFPPPPIPPDPCGEVRPDHAVADSQTASHEDDDTEIDETDVALPSKLTVKMLQLAETHLDKFCVKTWLELGTSRGATYPDYDFISDPPFSLIPDKQRRALVGKLSTIRDREALAAALFDWDFLEDCGNTLFEVVKHLHQEFEEMREEAK